MNKSRALAAEFATQLLFALLIGLCVSVILAGAALLLASGAQPDASAARAAMTVHGARA